MKALKTRPTNRKEVLQRYPRLTGHLICESLGYFTPGAAAHAILDYIEKRSNCCEWYVTMARGYDEKALLKVGEDTLKRAFEHRHHHYGYMAHYPQAKALVEHVRAGGEGPVFASWF